DTRGDYLPGANNDPNDTSDLTLAGLSDENNLLSKRVIYFDYNQASIRTEYMILINTHAKLAAKYPQLKMRLEGHADERGSREYNVALSEQRSQSVKRIMGIQGARSGQIKTIGYGEEIPIVMGHNKDSWQQNRRVEIKYENY
ncbi:MAG: OmpA family protein, partial [Thiotrichaceae bacterium]|nr:OmpA family protein [Thiotrichaceae bacterium]